MGYNIIFEIILIRSLIHLLCFEIYIIYIAWTEQRRPLIQHVFKNHSSELYKRCPYHNVLRFLHLLIFSQQIWGIVVQPACHWILAIPLLWTREIYTKFNVNSLWFTSVLKLKITATCPIVAFGSISMVSLVFVVFATTFIRLSSSAMFSLEIFCEVTWNDSRLALFSIHQTDRRHFRKMEEVLNGYVTNPNPTSTYPYSNP